MSTKYKLVQGDRRPYITVQVSDDATATPVDVSLSTTTVTGKFRKKNTSTVLQTITATKPNGGYDGLVQFAWPASALDVAAGNYELEITIDFNGQTQTVLDIVQFKLRADF